MLYKNITIALDMYAKIYPESDIANIIDFVKSDQTSVQRTNMHGHITASGLVLRDKEILLVFHKKLQRFIQPGGHLEETDVSLQEAARREVREETGIIVAASPFFPYEAPIHIDAHIIPANPKKGEPEHWHYDCMYLFSPRNERVNIDKSEVDDYQWVSLDYEFNDKGLTLALAKVKALLENQVVKH